MWVSQIWRRRTIGLIGKLCMYDVGQRLLSGIKSMYVNSSACVIVKGG